MTAEELADEEWGPAKTKKDKGKKGKKKGGAKAAEDEEEAAEPKDAGKQFIGPLILNPRIG